MGDNNNTTRLGCQTMTNKEILDIYVNNGLMKVCVDCAFAKAPPRDKEFRDDFFQDLYITLLSYPNDHLNRIHSEGAMNSFLSAVIRRNLWSKTSPYYQKYKKFADRASSEITEYLEDTTPDDVDITAYDDYEPNVDYDDDHTLHIKNAVGKLPYLDKKVFLQYCDLGGSYASLSRLYHCSKPTASKYIKKIRRKIYNNL